MRKLGDFIFPPGTIWRDIDVYVPYGVSVKRTLRGNVVVYKRAYQENKGRPIQIDFSQCALSRSTVDMLKGMAMTMEAAYLFEWDAFSATVIFSSGPHEFSPIFGVYTDDANMTKWQGILNLVVV